TNSSALRSRRWRKVYVPRMSHSAQGTSTQSTVWSTRSPASFITSSSCVPVSGAGSSTSRTSLDKGNASSVSLRGSRRTRGVCQISPAIEARAEDIGLRPELEERISSTLRPEAVSALQVDLRRVFPPGAHGVDLRTLGQDDPRVEARCRLEHEVPEIELGVVR